MSDTKSVSVQVGPGLPGLLFITFLVLKLTHVIDWSWWWVTAPLWGGLALALALGLIALVIALVATLVGDGKKKKKRHAGETLRSYERRIR